MPRKKSLRLPPRVRTWEINDGKDVTPASALVDVHYMKLGIHKLWNPQRLHRLCGVLQLTPHEVASLVMLSHQDMDKFLSTGNFPSIVSWALTLIETCIVPNTLKDYPIPEGDSLLPIDHVTAS